MPRIRLAYWHDGRAPGEETDVDEDTLRDLQRDGRVAAVLDPPPADPNPPEPSRADAVVEPAAESGGRKRR